MKTSHMIWLSATAVILVYLFVTAPPPLAEISVSNKSLHIKTVLAMMDRENKAVRALYTGQIVAAGKRAGLKFDEHWDDNGVDAGPLPAQFLRLTARHLETTRIPLGLYLGSDFPINPANLLTGQQKSYLDLIKAFDEPVFYYQDDIKRYIYMTADVAVSNACVKCHNRHKDSGKTDWKLNDVMGATTWIYPDDYVSYEQALLILQTLRDSVKQAYGAYLDKVAKFNSPPSIGEKWPRDGYFLPSADAFMQEVSRQASPRTLNLLTLHVASNH